MKQESDRSLVPRLRFPEFRDRWISKKLGNCIQLISGSHLSPDEYRNSGEVPYFTGPSDFTNNDLGIAKWTNKTNCCALENDVLITVKGNGVGELWYLKLTAVAMGRQLMAIRSVNCLSQFIFQFLTTQKDQFQALGSGNLIPGLSRGDILDLALQIPSPEEQQKIAECLASIDDRITLETQKLDALRVHKKGLMQQLFPSEGQTLPQLRFPEFRDSGEWEEKRLGQLLEFKNGINASKEQYGKGTKFINVLDILQNEFITYEKIIGSVDVSDEILNKFPVNYGDVLFQRSSETQEEVGTASVYLDRERTATFGGFVIRGKKIGEYEPFFLNKLLKSQHIRNSISSKSGGSTRFNIGQENLSTIKIFLPSIQEQQKIANCLTSLDELITLQAQTINALKLHKKGLMQQLFPSVNEVSG